MRSKIKNLNVKTNYIILYSGKHLYIFITGESTGFKHWASNFKLESLDLRQ